MNQQAVSGEESWAGLHGGFSLSAVCSEVTAEALLELPVLSSSDSHHSVPVLGGYWFFTCTLTAGNVRSSQHECNS